MSLDLFDQPHAGAQNVGNVSLFQFLDRFRADHTSVGNDAKAVDSKAFANPVCHRNQGFDIGGIARPHLTADRPALIVR